MSRFKGTFLFGANFEVGAAVPLDARQMVGCYSDLTSPATWCFSPSCSNMALFNGMIVAVGSDPISANNGIYYLCDSTNYTMTCSWIKAGTGVDLVSGATNGLGIINKNVCLGGNLNTGTTINGQGLHALNISNVTEFQVSTSGSSTLLGIDDNGFLFSFTGGSLTFDDNGGLKYGADYSANYSPRSLVDAGFVTGLTGTYLKLDQTTPQSVCYGQPIFHEGLVIDEFPQPSMVTGHTSGRIFYDPIYETATVQIGHPDSSGHGVNLQLGQEMVRLVWNETASIIPNGAVVRSVGTHCGGGICADVTAVCLAKADTMACALAIGVATQAISASSYGYITTVGYVNDLNTVTGPYSGLTAGNLIYLSPTVAGGVTNIAPPSPNVQIYIGRLATTGTTARLDVQIQLLYSLNDLSDVVVPSPSVDDVLKWNGLDWVNGTVGSTSAGSGVNFYYATPIINNVTQPVGLDSTGTLGNGVAVYSLSKTPVTSGGTQTVCGCVNTSGTYAAVAWLYNTSLGRSVIDSGTWEFTAWLCVDSSVNTTCVTNNMYQVVPITGGTISITGASANARTATISSSQFAGTYFTASTVNTNASWLQTTTGIYQICSCISNNQVCIVVPTGYINTNSSGQTWNKLFGVASPEIDSTSFICYVTTLAEPSFNIACTDKLGRIGFISSTATHTVSVTYNGNTQASYIKTPLITLHNDLAGLQGGTGNERYHITCAQNQLLAGITASAAEINVLDGIPPTLTSTELGYVDGVTSDIQTQLDSKLNKSIFTGYTASTSIIINNAITGVTNCGGGESVCSSISGHNLFLDTIVGSGCTSISKVGNEIIIFSTGGTSGGDLYNYGSPSICPAGGMCVGTVLTGKTALKILQEILVPELCGVLTAPSTSIALSYSGLYEIGCPLSQSVSGSFSRGSINPQYCSPSPFRSGCAISYSFTGCGMPVGFQACALTPATQTNPSYIVSAGTSTWGVCTCYGAGQCAMGNAGTVFATALPAGCTTQATNSIVGVYPLYATTVNITTMTKQTLQNMSTANNIQVNLVADVSPDKQKFEIPCAWLGSRPLAGVCQWNTVSSQWEYPGGSAGSSLAIWTCSASSETVQGNTVGYCRYTYNSTDRSAVCIRLVF